jgi:uncharacterized protein YndB with AHSA1/START domain
MNDERSTLHVAHIEHTVIIQAPAERVMSAFFNADDLHAWWQVIRSVTVPRPLGTFAVEWESTGYRDEILGRLGGTFHGTVIEYRPATEFFVGDAYWQPPEGDPIGPMALEVRCRPQGGSHITRLSVRQSGEDDGPRWQRYFEVVSSGWQRALAELKAYLDREAMRERR